MADYYVQAELRQSIDNGFSLWTGYFEVDKISRLLFSSNPEWFIHQIWPHTIMEKTDEGLKPIFTDEARRLTNSFNI